MLSFYGYTVLTNKLNWSANFDQLIWISFEITPPISHSCNFHLKSIIKCVFKRKHSCIGCITRTLLRSEFSNVPSKFLPVQMHSRIGYICTIFLLSEFSNVLSNCAHEQLQSRIGYIWMIFLLSEFSNVSSDCLPEQIHSHIGCICTIFLQSEHSSVSSNCLPEQMQNHIGCFYVAFPYVFFLTNCWMFHKKKRSWWWQISTILSSQYICHIFPDE